MEVEEECKINTQLNELEIQEDDVIRKKVKSNSQEAYSSAKKQITDNGYTIEQTGVAHSGFLIGTICIFK